MLVNVTRNLVLLFIIFSKVVVLGIHIIKAVNLIFSAKQKLVKGIIEVIILVIMIAHISKGFHKGCVGFVNVININDVSIG